jgi:hypothetical protein
MTDFDKIHYEPKSHTYTYNGKILMPVTSMIKWVTPEFQGDELLEIKAYETGRSVQDIQAEWDAKRDAGLDKGTRVHSYIENVIEGVDQRILISVNDYIHEMQQFDDAWGRLRANLDAKLYKKEWTVGDEELGIAGRVDALLKIDDDKTERLSIFDWKTGKFMIRKYARENMLPPFDDLPACEEIKYSIQISTYRLIIERNTDHNMHGGFILHLPADYKYNLYNVVDLRERIEAWLIDMNKAGIMGNPQADKQATRVSNSFEQFDDALLRQMSPQARQKLLMKAAKLLQRGKKYLGESF